MMNRTYAFCLASLALALVSQSSFADTEYFNFPPVAGDSFGTGGNATSVSVTGTLGNVATFSQANSAAASYDFTFGANAGLYSNIASTTVLSSGGYAYTTQTPAELTITFASTVYAVNFNWANNDPFAADTGDIVQGLVNGNVVYTSTGGAPVNPNDNYAEGAFSYASTQGFKSITLESFDAAGAQDLNLGDLTTSTTPVPLPAGIWLLSSSLAALGFGRRKKAA